MEAERAASWAFRSRGLVGALLGAAFGVLVLFSPPLFDDAQWEKVPLEILGWLIFFAGAGLRFWATLYIGGRKRLVVVNEGPYSVCRHPLYVGTFLIALSVAVMLQSMTFLTCVLVGGAFYALATVPAEERYLTGQLGESYLRYCQEVPRFVPRLSNFSTPMTLVVSIRALRLECSRAARWVLLPVLADLLCQVRGEAWWPHWINLP
ncbi:MAG TPA: isoprenylcysteine carboxylmethyltransferase family protein [Pirellulales bacterium]|nr:isoprenylcysteine carboxylmethyltransferase family protein [Pirellulales bacterium]